MSGRRSTMGPARERVLARAARAAHVPLVPPSRPVKDSAEAARPPSGAPPERDRRRPMGETLDNVDGRPADEAAPGAVLLVEDDMPLRDQMRMALEAAGHDVLEAADAVAARALLAAGEAPAVVVLDMGLPPRPASAEEGLRLLAELLEDSERQVIVLTGQGERAIAREAVRLGAIDYLLKPTPMDQLLGAVRRALFFGTAGAELADQGLREVRFTAELGEGLEGVRDAAVRQTVRAVLRDTGFNVYRSAQILGVKRETLYYFIRKYGLRRDGASEARG